jgi:hypothetical protein
MIPPVVSLRLTDNHSTCHLPAAETATEITTMTEIDITTLPRVEIVRGLPKTAIDLHLVEKTLTGTGNAVGGMMIGITGIEMIGKAAGGIGVGRESERRRDQGGTKIETRTRRGEYTIP